tara:strand:- start:2731 stop:3264 length:534 start_codon:yes stop_codon:yes gene_type:complete
MPRLAPDGSRCKEHRITFGNQERKFLAQLQKQQNNNTLIRSFAIPLTGLIVAGGIGLAGYFLMPNIITEVEEKLEIGKQAVKNTVKSASGQQQDGSYATILSTEGANTGRVIVAAGSGIPVIGALTGATLNLLRSVGQGGWVGIYGNFNKDAQTIEDLTEGWLYLNDLPGGSGQSWT